MTTKNIFQAQPNVSWGVGQGGNHIQLRTTDTEFLEFQSGILILEHPPIYRCSCDGAARAIMGVVQKPTSLMGQLCALQESLLPVGCMLPWGHSAVNLWGPLEESSRGELELTCLMPILKQPQYLLSHLCDQFWESQAWRFLGCRTWATLKSL